MTTTTPTTTENTAATPAVASRQVRAAAAAAVLITLVIAVGAFMLSFAALADLAAKAGQPPELAWIWPVIVDGSILQATVAVVALAARDDAGGSRRFFWSVLAAAAAVSIAGNALHAAVSDTRVLGTAVAAVVATIAPISLLAATHGLALLVRTPYSTATSPATSLDTVPTTATPAVQAAAGVAAPLVSAIDTASPTTSPSAAQWVPAPVLFDTPVAAATGDGDAGVAASAASLDAAAAAVARKVASGDEQLEPEDLRPFVDAKPKWSTRRIAAAIGVHHSTVARRIRDLPAATPSFRVIAGGVAVDAQEVGHG